jgi:hypothetical protein
MAVRADVPLRSVGPRSCGSEALLFCGSHCQFRVQIRGVAVVVSGICVGAGPRRLCPVLPGRSCWQVKPRRAGNDRSTIRLCCPMAAHSSASKTLATTSRCFRRQISGSTSGRPQIECLMLVVKLGGPTMFARIGMLRALNRHVERVFDPSRKDKHWRRRQLARDR